MLKLILIAILTLSNISYCVDHASATVEMYSDEMPKTQSVFLGKMPDSCYFVDKKDGPGFAFFKASLKKFLKEKGFYFAQLRDEYCMEENYRNSFVIYKEDLPGIFLDVCLNKKSLDPKLSKYRCKLHDSVLTSNKWESPQTVYSWSGKYTAAHSLSWRYVDLLLHCRENVSWTKSTFSTSLDKVLFDNINKNGLQKAVIRGNLTFNKKGDCCLNILYNSDQELMQSNDLLMVLQSFFM